MADRASPDGSKLTTPTRRTAGKRLLFALVVVLGLLFVLVEVYFLSPEFRAVCVGGLGKIGPGGWLVALLDDPAMDVRGAASDALVRGGPSSVPALLVGLVDPEAARRSQACIVLGRIGPPASNAIPTLKGLMQEDPDENVRTQAAKAMGILGQDDPEILADLMNLLGEGDEAGRIGAAEAIGAMGEKARAAVPLLIRALRDGRPRIREEAAEALGSMGTYAGPAIPALVDALGDPEAKVRAEVTEALGRIVGALGDGDAALRDRAKAALDKARSATALPSTEKGPSK